jgi:hypothetical protein
LDGVTNIVIAPRFLPELRKLPDSVLSFANAFEQVMWTRKREDRELKWDSFLKQSTQVS